MTEFIVTYNNKKYNITEYIDKHPGGKKILQKYQRQDITTAFDKIGHSKTALEIMKKYRIVEEENNDNTDDKYNSDKSRNLILKKLFTEEDKHLIHKTFGILSLFSFVYRYTYLLKYNTFGFVSPLFTWTSLLVHTLLSSSSLIFHVLERRIVTNPLLIYEEYRLHAILFTLRSVGISIIGLYNIKDKYTTVIFLLLIHILVDITTMLYGTKGVTAVRGSKNPKFVLKVLQLFFSFYQFIAIGCHLSNKASIEDGFNTLIAIQSSAFLMTLRRKNLIKDWQYVFWYGSSLILSIYAFILNHSSILFAVIGVLFYLRVQFSVNKYVIWTIFTILYHKYDLNLIIDNF